MFYFVSLYFWLVCVFVCLFLWAMLPDTNKYLSIYYRIILSRHKASTSSGSESLSGFVRSPHTSAAGSAHMRPCWSQTLSRLCSIVSASLTSSSNNTLGSSIQHIDDYNYRTLTLSPPIPLRLYTLPHWSNPPFLISDIRTLCPYGKTP